MALIPYRDVPETETEKKDPSLVLAGMPAEEYYCGDERCDCATGHLVLGGLHLTVDLGTTRVDFADNQASQGREVLQQTVRQALQAGAINQLRRHYGQTREYGKLNHFRYVDWTPLKSGELVPWLQVFRHEGVPMFTMTVTAADADKAKKDEDEAADKAQFLLGLADAYCIEPKCDCQRVVFTVVTSPVQRPDSPQQLGTVSYSFKTRQPAVEQVAQNVNPNQLFMLVANLLKGQPELPSMYEQRYGFLRQQLSPILQNQRRLRSQGKGQQSVGRNDPCPCGSGKKYKRCHGAS